MGGQLSAAAASSSSLFCRFACRRLSTMDELPRGAFFVKVAHCLPSVMGASARAAWSARAKAVRRRFLAEGGGESRSVAHSLCGASRRRSWCTLECVQMLAPRLLFTERKPSKQKRPVGRPLAASAQTAAQQPGTDDRMCSAQSATRSSPGSETASACGVGHAA